MRILNVNSLATNIFDDLSDNEVLLFHYGELNFEVTNQIILSAKKILKDKNISRSVYNNIYSACVEATENAYKYQKNEANKHAGFFIMSCRNNYLNISVGNPIEPAKRIDLNDRIGGLVKLSNTELKELVNSKIAMNRVSVKEETASVGLMKIVLNTENRTKAIFKEFGNGKLLFILEMNFELI